MRAMDTEAVVNGTVYVKGEKVSNPLLLRV
jgi:hypothetical protein